MKSKLKNKTKLQLSQKEQLMEIAALSLAILLLLASVIKVLFV